LPLQTRPNGPSPPSGPPSAAPRTSSCSAPGSAYAQLPADGEPIVGPVAEVPGLYLAVMHSAVTLAPAVGRLVARELVDGTVESALAGCRLDRF